MSTEAFEAQANQITAELTKGGVRLSGELSRAAWAQLVQVAQDMAKGLVRHGPEVLTNGILVSSTKVGVRELERTTHGNRDGVDLTNPTIAQAVQRALSREGVTYAVTRHEGSTRIHIGAGNAAQLEHAMQVAERSVAQQIERREQRAARREHLADHRTAIRDGLRERLAQIHAGLPGKDGSEPTRSPDMVPTFLPMVTLGIDGMTPDDNAARLGYAQAVDALLAESDDLHQNIEQQEIFYDQMVEQGASDAELEQQVEAIRQAREAYRNHPGPSDFPDVDTRFIDALVRAEGDVTRVVDSREFVREVTADLGLNGVESRKLWQDVTMQRPTLETNRAGFDQVKRAVNDVRKHVGLPLLDDKKLAKALDLDIVPPVEKLTKGKSR